MAIQLRDHALQALLHPITLLAIVVQLLNDHVLRRVSPSPMWGKLGDVTMLIYAPVLAATLLALVIPTTDLRGRRRVGLAGVGLVGLWFTLGKTVPAVLTATNALLTTLTGRPSVLILDPTDLIALPALGLAWWVWEHPLRLERSLGLRPFGVAALTLGWLATVATSVPTPDVGIYRVCILRSQLTAQAPWADGTQEFSSGDGGVSWRPVTPPNAKPEWCPESTEPLSTSWSIAAQGPDRLYRLEEEVGIDRSDDGGTTWRRLYDAGADGISAAYAEEFYYGPLGAVLDPGTGNLVVAMGRRGVIVITPEDHVRWATVGIYTRAYTPATGLLLVLQYPIILGVLLLPAALFFIGYGALPVTPNVKAVGIMLAISIILPGLFTFPSGRLPGDGISSSATQPPVSQMPLLILIVLAPIAGLIAYQQLTQASGGRIGLALSAALISLLASAAFLLPFGLWAATGYPEFGYHARSFGPSPAVWFAGILAGLLILGGRIWVHAQLKRARLSLTQQGVHSTP